MHLQTLRYFYCFFEIFTGPTLELEPNSSFRQGPVTKLDSLINASWGRPKSIDFRRSPNAAYIMVSLQRSCPGTIFFTIFVWFFKVFFGALKKTCFRAPSGPPSVLDFSSSPNTTYILVLGICETGAETSKPTLFFRQV